MKSIFVYHNYSFTLKFILMKTTFLFFMIVIMSCFISRAQIPNANFECILSDSTLCNWGTDVIIAFALDSNGHPLDSLVFDGGKMVSFSKDAHAGNYAMEIRNAWNFSQQIGYSGSALAATDTTFGTYLTAIPISQNPGSFSFYYKYLPVNNDTAVAQIKILNVNAQVIGHASINILPNGNLYTMRAENITYDINDIGAFATITFRNSKSNPTFGSRLLIDDVSFNAPLNNQDIYTNNMIQLYPNPGSTTLNIFAPSPVIYIFNIDGQIIHQINNFNNPQISVTEWPNGIYFISTSPKLDSQAQKFIKL